MKPAPRARTATGDVALIEVVGLSGDGMPLARLTKARPNAPTIRLDPTTDPRLTLALGDRALARLRGTGAQARARVIRRLPRTNARAKAGSESFIGLIQRDGPHAPLMLAPASGRGRVAMALEKPGLLAEGDIVRAIPLGAPSPRARGKGPRRAKALSVLQRGADKPLAPPWTDLAIHEHAIEETFPDDTLTQARAAEAVGDWTGYEDLTALPFITIDPADARDHDDAVFAQADPANPGGWRVMAAIADVARYVPRDSALDRAARARGNSAYFPDRVAPMLPEILSADLCSLHEGQDRPALVARLTLNAEGQRIDGDMVRAKIRVRAGLTYEQAQRGLDGDPDAATQPFMETAIIPLRQAFAAMTLARTTRAPLGLNTPELVFTLDANGAPTEKRLTQTIPANTLIEEIMVAANALAGELLVKRQAAAIHRSHPAPDPSRVDELRGVLQALGIVWRPTLGAATTQDFNALLTMAKQRGPTTEAAINLAALRTQSQAVYAPDSRGHFGLNLTHYAHFTSPIRRYADLATHRALIRALGLGINPDDDAQDMNDEERQDLADDLSRLERRATQAERDTNDRYTAAIARKNIGQVMEGAITGIIPAGAFARVDDGGEGFAPMATLPGGRWRFSSRDNSLTPARGRLALRLGTRVRARLEHADPVRGDLRLTILDVLPPR